MNSTKGKITRAFKELVCKKSFQKITISDIAKECGMTRENFYYHFRDKFDIVRWIFEQEVLEAAAGERDFIQWLKAILNSLNQEHTFFKRIIREIGKETVRENFGGIMEERLRVCIEPSIEAAVWNMRKERTDFVTSFFANGLIEFILQSVMENEMVDRELFEQNLSFLFRNYLPFVRMEKEKEGVLL